VLQISAQLVQLVLGNALHLFFFFELGVEVVKLVLQFSVLLDRLVFLLLEGFQICFQLLPELLFISPLLLHLASSLLFFSSLLPVERLDGRLLV